MPYAGILHSTEPDRLVHHLHCLAGGSVVALDAAGFVLGTCARRDGKEKERNKEMSHGLLLVDRVSGFHSSTPRSYLRFFFVAPSTMAVRLWALAADTLMNLPVIALRPMPDAFFDAVFAFDLAMWCCCLSMLKCSSGSTR